ncbi:type II secretion system protein [Halobium salinum]|uniref:Type II secretion system protein n=1 Tax=Halobium salinum TaxID=1364940 RepID=A0ABD5PDF1_9EURY|nr:type II secretion system protein [Halobium salinum]
MSRTSGERRLDVAVKSLAGVYPWPAPDAGDDLSRALAFLDSARAPSEVVAAGYVAGAVAAALLLPLTVVLPPLVATAAAVAAGFGTMYAAHRGPVVLARIRRTRALGASSDLVGRAVLRMRLDPALEGAAAFAARGGDGPLVRSLRRHVRRAAGTPRSGLDDFAAEWGSSFAALDRSVSLLVAGAAAPAEERARTLDRALDTVLEGTREELAAFAGRVRGPATGLYAFGVLLPLALVGVVPAAGVAGIGVTPLAFVLVYDLLLPGGLLTASVWLVSRRPVAFPPPSVTRDHPGVPERRWSEPAAALSAGVTGWVGAGVAAGDWAAPVAAVGAGAGAWLVVRYRPVASVRERVRAVEAGLPDALYLVGRRVAEGVAVEVALDRAADEVPDATGDVLGDAVRVGRTLRVDVHSAFLGDCGALADVPSPRLRGAARLLALAAAEGRPAGETVVAMADQLADLRRLEREARRELASVTGTLSNTAALFGPLVGGATVALADAMADHAGGEGMTGAPTAPNGAAGATGGAALATADLGPAVFVYVLLLAAILTGLAVALERGLDPALVGYRVGLALLSATATFLAAVAGAGLLA